MILEMKLDFIDKQFKRYLILKNNRMEEKLNNIQVSYNEKIGYTEKICCFKVKTLTQLIPVLVVVRKLKDLNMFLPSLIIGECPSLRVVSHLNFKYFQRFI